MPASGTDLLPRDAWLSEHLGWPAYRLPEDAGPEVVVALHGPCLVSAKCPVTDLPRMHALENAGFRLVDTNVALQKTRGDECEAGATVRDARAADQDAVAMIASTSFRWSRFHRDPSIPIDRANAIKEAWARAYFRGTRGDRCLIAQRDGQIAGFLIAMIHDDLVTTDLIATHPDFQRRGVARELMTSLESRFMAAACLRVGTQLANLPSLALYQSLGYTLFASFHVFHFHAASV